jgi:hypothetical protein
VNRAGPGKHHHACGGDCRRLQAGDLGAASSADLISLALDNALRMFGSSEPNSKVMSLLQCWQLT